MLGRRFLCTINPVPNLFVSVTGTPLLYSRWPYFKFSLYVPLNFVSERPITSHLKPLSSSSSRLCRCSSFSVLTLYVHIFSGRNFFCDFLFVLFIASPPLFAWRHVVRGCHVVPLFIAAFRVRGCSKAPLFAWRRSGVSNVLGVYWMMNLNLPWSYLADRSYCCPTSVGESLMKFRKPTEKRGSKHELCEAPSQML